MNLSLFDAFSRYGAKPGNRVCGLSAMAADGALVLNCSTGNFGHPARGVLRYEDRLCAAAAESKETRVLREHLMLARDGSLPVRMVVTLTAGRQVSTRSGGYQVRRDLIGRIVEFDGDHFVVDFTRLEALQLPVPAARRRK